MIQKPPTGHVSANNTTEFVELGERSQQEAPDLSIKLGLEVKVHQNKHFSSYLEGVKTSLSQPIGQLPSLQPEPSFKVMSPPLSERMKLLSNTQANLLSQNAGSGQANSQMPSWPVKVTLVSPEFIDMEDTTSNLSERSSSGGTSEADGDSQEEQGDEDQEFVLSDDKFDEQDSTAPEDLPDLAKHPKLVLKEKDFQKLKIENELLQRELQKLKEAQQNERNRLESLPGCNSLTKMFS